MEQFRALYTAKCNELSVEPIPSVLLSLSEDYRADDEK